MRLIARLTTDGRGVACVAVLSVLAVAAPGYAYEDSLRKLHLAYNTQDWSGVTEHFADMGRPGNLDGVTYARVAEAATRVYRNTKSRAYCDLALQCYDLAAASDPTLADEHYYAKAELLRKEKNHDAALTAYLDALRVDPRHVSAAAWAIWFLLDDERSADAAEAGRGLLEVRGPISSILLHGLINLAQAEAREGNRNAAVKVLRRAWALGPTAWQPEILYGWARCCARLGDYDQARTSLREALTALPADSELRPTFEEYLKRVTAVSTTRPAARAEPDAQAPVTADRKQPPAEEAKPTRQRPEDDAESRTFSLMERAQALADEGKTDDAIELLEQAVALTPQLPAPAARLAVLHVAGGDYEAAVKVLETAIRNNPDNGILRQMLERLGGSPPASQPGG